MPVPLPTVGEASDALRAAEAHRSSLLDATREGTRDVTGPELAAADAEITLAQQRVTGARDRVARNAAAPTLVDDLAALAADTEARRDAAITANVAAGRSDIRARSRHYAAAGVAQ